MAHAPITQVHSFKPQSRCTFIILPICLQLQEIEDWLKHFLVNRAAPPPERVLGWWLGVLASAKEAAASVIWEFMELATSSLWPGRIYERISIWQLPRPAPGPTMLPQTVIWAAADRSSFSDKRDLNDLLGFILTSQSRAMSTGQDKTGVSTYCECDLHYLGSFSFVRAFCGHSPISIVSSFSNHPQSASTNTAWHTSCVWCILTVYDARRQAGICCLGAVCQWVPARYICTMQGMC